MSLKNKFNRVAEDKSQLQEFANKVCDSMDDGEEGFKEILSEKQIESIAKLVSKEEFTNSIPSLKFVGVELPSSGNFDASQYEPFTCLNCEGEVKENLVVLFSESIKFIFSFDVIEGNTYSQFGNYGDIPPATYDELGKAGYNCAVIILKNIAIICTWDNN